VKLFETGLPALESGPAADLPALIRSRLVLSHSLARTGRGDEARRLLETCYRDSLTTPGVAPDQRALLANNYGVDLMEQGRFAESEQVLRAGLERSRSEGIGLDLSGPLMLQSSLAYVLRAQNRLDECEPLLRDALEQSRRFQGEASFQTLRLQTALGKLCITLGRLDEAVALLERTCAGFRGGPDAASPLSQDAAKYLEVSRQLRGTGALQHQPSTASAQ
jgi:tetratricopeptide (TPR) repeat protein